MTPGFVDPAYQHRSIGDVLPAVARALGVDAGLPPSSIELPAASRYVVFLVDGLGHELLSRNEAQAPYLHSLLGSQEPVTVGVPSTTATSLTSFGTALRPGSHGVVGYTCRIPGTEHLLNALSWSKSVDPLQWQPHPTALGRLAAAGVTTTVVNKREFAGSGLTVAGQRGADFVGADKVGERMAAVLRASRAQPSLTYAYEGDLDWTGHRYGVASTSWQLQLNEVDASVQHLRRVLPDDVRILVLADHGMVDSPPTRRIDVADRPELKEGLVLLGGEARFRHLYCRDGAVPDVLAAWTSALAGRAEVLSRDDALGRGWFGPVEDHVRPRLGDVMVASLEDYSVLFSTAFPHESSLVGLHGSLTPAEMLVPVLVC